MAEQDFEKWAEEQAHEIFARYNRARYQREEDVVAALREARRKGLEEAEDAALRHGDAFSVGDKVVDDIVDTIRALHHPEAEKGPGR